MQKGAWVSVSCAFALRRQNAVSGFRRELLQFSLQCHLVNFENERRLIKKIKDNEIITGLK